MRDRTNIIFGLHFSSDRESSRTAQRMQVDWAARESQY